MPWLQFLKNWLIFRMGEASIVQMSTKFVAAPCWAVLYISVLPNRAVHSFAVRSPPRNCVTFTSALYRRLIHQLVGLPCLKRAAVQQPQLCSARRFASGFPREVSWRHTSQLLLSRLGARPRHPAEGTPGQSTEPTRWSIHSFCAGTTKDLFEGNPIGSRLGS